MLAMQNRDGGWGAFDRDNDRHFLCYVPFADHNAMIDPSTPDLCGRVLEALGKLGRRVGDPHVDRAVEFVRRTQEADGSWFGRWGVNYIYGTWQVLTGLVEVGVPQARPGRGGGGYVAAGPSTGQRRLGRVAQYLRATGTSRAGASHRVADRLGRVGLDRRRHGRSSSRPPRRALSCPDAKPRRRLDGNAIHGHRLPLCFLSPLPLLPDLFPLDGLGPLDQGNRRAICQRAASCRKHWLENPRKVPCDSLFL